MVMLVDFLAWKGALLGFGAGGGHPPDFGVAWLGFEAVAELMDAVLHTAELENGMGQV
jgi:hypothetical protein